MSIRLWLRTGAIAGTVLGVAAMAGDGGAAPAAPGVFASPSTLPLQAPRFDLIRDSDYQPGFDQGMAEQSAEIRRIADNPAAPTFDNTIAAMERSGRMLDRVSLAFGGVVQANTNPILDRVQEVEAPRLAQHQDMIYLNPKLFARVRTLYTNRATLRLDPEQRQLLTVYYQQFIHAGAQLSDAQKAKLRALNTRISSLETAFQQKLVAAAKAGALVVDDPARLAGLDAGALAAAAQDARGRNLTGRWLIPLQNTTQQPALSSLADRATRQALFEQSWTRAEKGDANDTRGTIEELATLRAQKAALLGAPNWASYVLFDQMAKTPAAVQRFISQIVPATAAEERREAADVQAAIRAGGENFDLKPWDWARYSERVRKARFDLDESEIRPYLELNRVLQDGVFYAAHELYGISFHERKDIPVYQSDVRVFDVIDKDGSQLGLIYFDYFKRDNKTGGAWMSNFVNQSKLLGTKPVVYNVANLTKPAPGQPALLSFDDVTTMFHEFGHALHGLFASQVYPTISGTSVARDFVEFPSQFNEHWALEPAVLRHYARDYRTGAPMPQSLVDKIKRAGKFNQGYALGELIAAAQLDMAWHTLPVGGSKQKTDSFEAGALGAMGLDIADVPPRYRSSYFLHIWANGYSAGYYAYLWTQMLDDDSFAWFKAHGGLTRANGQRFRDMILSRGHTADYGAMFRAFYGKDPEIGPMLQHRGLAPGGD
jgi:peptidyl-dipeptidase Dcp